MTWRSGLILVQFSCFQILPESYSFVGSTTAKSPSSKAPKSAKSKAQKRLPAVPKLKIFVASTVYNFEDQLRQICGVLTSLGYEVWNSHLGTVPVSPALSNRENCIEAVKACDLFLGI